MSIDEDERQFIDLEEPPAAKDNLTEVIEETFHNTSRPETQSNNYRRASVTHDEHAMDRSRNGSRNASMNLQDAMRSQRLSTENNGENIVDDLLEDTKPNDQVGGVTFNEEYTESAYEPEPPLSDKNVAEQTRRKSSIFEHENYKKEMYDRVEFK